MQFPRGRFTAIKKGTRICDLLGELKHSRFSGYCIITRGTETGSLVLKNGNCLLAGYQDLEGDSAWIAIQRIEESEADAQLMHLTPAQLDLAIEFNQGARIERRITHVHREKQGTVPVHGTTEERKSPTRIPKTRTSPESPGQDTGSTGRPAHTGHALRKRTLPVNAGTLPEEGNSAQQATGGETVPVEPCQSMRSDTETGISSGHREVEINALSLPEDLTPGTPEKPLPKAEPAQGSSIPPVPDETAAGQGREERSGLPEGTVPVSGGGEERSPNAGFIRELAALDAMDLQCMSEKIRVNCRMIVQGLHLEHLLDQQEDKTQ
jgi:hypothetical protein